MMMTTKTLYARAGATAIAAVLALSSTPLAAQEVPAPTEPVTVAPPPPSTTATPAPDVTPTPEVAAPVTGTPKTTSVVKTTATKRTATVKRTPALASKPVASKAAPVEAAAPATAAAPVAAHPTPIVDTTPPKTTAAPTVTPPPATSNRFNGTALELGAGAIALLALGGAAVALNGRRRRHAEDEEVWTEETYEPVRSAAAPELVVAPRHDPVAEAQSPFIAPPISAFSWGNTPSHATRATTATTDEKAGETWVERAYRGPSPDNPSLSLRKRLKRAAFFDKRDREVAAGKAPPVEHDAGLPDNVSTREFEAA